MSGRRQEAVGGSHPFAKDFGVGPVGTLEDMCKGWNMAYRTGRHMLGWGMVIYQQSGYC